MKGGSSVGIATEYGLDGPGSNPGGDEIFRLSRPALGPTQAPVQLVPGLSRGVLLTTHPLLVPRSCKSRAIRQMKHQLDATLCRFYFCRVTLHVSGASAHHQEYLKVVRRSLVRVLSLQVSHHISLLGPSK